jgi:hypothetical protein
MAAGVARADEEPEPDEGLAYDRLADAAASKILYIVPCLLYVLSGATCTASCTNSGNVWTCPLTESSGTNALIVWNATVHSWYRRATEYVDYKCSTANLAARPNL